MAHQRHHRDTEELLQAPGQQPHHSAHSRGSKPERDGFSGVAGTDVLSTASVSWKRRKSQVELEDCWLLNGEKSELEDS